MWKYALLRVSHAKGVERATSGSSNSSDPGDSVALARAAQGFSLSDTAAAHVESSQLTKYQMLLDGALDALVQRLVLLTSNSMDEFDAIGPAIVEQHHETFAHFLAAKAAGQLAVGGPGVPAEDQMQQQLQSEWQATKAKFHTLERTWGLRKENAHVSMSRRPARAQTRSSDNAHSGAASDSDSSDGEL